MSEQCFTLPFWAGLDEVINQYIDSVTLEQLASQLPAPDSAAQESCCSCGGSPAFLYPFPAHAADSAALQAR